MNRIKRNPSWNLCRQLAGAESAGNVGDLADVVACAIESAEGRPSERGPNDPSVEEGKAAIGMIRRILDAAEMRLVQLELELGPKQK